MLKNSKLKFDQLSRDLGGFSYFQWRTILLASFSSFLGGVMVVVPVFTGLSTKYRCKIPNCDVDGTKYAEEFLNFTTPWEEKSNEWNQCQHYAIVNSMEDCSSQSFDNSSLTYCNEYVFENKVFDRTTMTQFGLTCKNFWLVSMGSSSYMIGMFVGSLVIGFISDYFGRRFGLFLSILLVIFGAIVGAFSPSYEMLLVMRTITGAGGMGCFQVAFVIAIEYVGPRFRTACGIAINIPFALGECFLGFLAYQIRDWQYLQLVAVSPAIITLLTYFFMPESFLWLISQERDKEAFQIIETVAKMNGKDVPSYLSSFQEPSTVEETSENEVGRRGVKDLFNSRIILLRSLILFHCWITATMVYFGLSSYGTKLSDDLFLNFTALILIEIPSYLCSIYFIDRIGRKGWHLLVFVLAGTGCILSAVLPREKSLLILLMNLMGKFGGSAAFASLFLYTAELYPTEYRALGVGACSMNARIGGILAPFINTLKIIYYPLPAFVYGVSSFISAFLILLLPETHGLQLPQTVEESENFGKNQKLCYMICCNSKENSSTNNSDDEISNS